MEWSIQILICALVFYVQSGNAVDTEGGYKCVFPFTFNGQQHNKCIQKGEKSLCAVLEANMDKFAYWDFCVEDAGGAGGASGGSEGGSGGSGGSEGGSGGSGGSEGGSGGSGGSEGGSGGGSSGGGGNLSKDEEYLLQQHNILRAKVANGKIPGHPAAADMTALKWNAKLAAKAQNWASQCKVGHDEDDARLVAPWDWVGQNFAGDWEVSGGMNGWFDEYKDFSYGTNTCSSGKACGHYTQVAWAKTLEIGCAVVKCGEDFIYGNSIVCDYGPGGNFNGEKPYVDGPACSKCPPGYDKCENGLCSK